MINYEQYLPYVPYVIFLIMAFIISILIIAYLRQSNIISKGLSKSFEYTRAKERLREEEERRNYKIWGIQEEKGIVKKIDNTLRQSGLKAYLPFLSAENFIYIEILISFIVAVIAFIFSGSLLITLIAFIVFPLLSYIIINIAADRTYKKTEENLLLFIDLVHTYSLASDDIIKILDVTSYQMSEPLRSNLAACCNKARITGNISEAMNDLANETGHEKFYEVFTNLEIGSKYKANYKELIESMKSDIEQYLSNREEEKELKRSAKVTWIILLVFGVVSVYMTQGLGDKPIMEVLMSNILGQLILGYCLILVIVVLIQIFKNDNK